MKILKIGRNSEKTGGLIIEYLMKAFDRIANLYVKG